MQEQIKAVGNVASGLARNPLGIIALFIVLVYGFASLVTTFGGFLSGAERLPLIYFLVCFPILVLAVFAWLVSGHSSKLFAPADFKNEDNYVRMQLAAAVSLATAAAKNPGASDLEGIVDAVVHVGSRGGPVADSWRNKILWVDDRPDNNVYERRAFEAVGLEFTLALSTSDALEKLKRERFAAIISDMGRREGPREGYVLLDTIRRQGDMTPLFFYASSNAPEHKAETEDHGGQGCTNNVQELFQMVTRAVIKTGARQNAR